MSISIDDLTSSLSASHIGQEAIDLAALQAQLAQTLFSQSIAHSSRKVSRNSSYTQPCTTPTFSSSFTLATQLSEVQISTSWDLEGSPYDSKDDMEEDERMVEDLLVPRSPMSATPSISQFSMPTSSSHKPQVASHQMPETSPSMFMSTDPFYIAQFQAESHDIPPPSLFTQLGRPMEQSPFTLQTSLQRREHPGTSKSAPPACVDTQSLFAASTTF